MAFNFAKFFRNLFGFGRGSHTTPVDPPIPPQLRPIAVIAVNGARVSLDQQPTPYTGICNSDGYLLFPEVPESLVQTQLTVTAAGYKPYSVHVSLPAGGHDLLCVNDGPLKPYQLQLPLLERDRPQWSKAQLLDWQGDLMIWCPALAPHFVNGVDPETGIHEHADTGATPHGIHAGWIWTLWLPFYPAAKRQVLYDTIKGYGFTHVAIQATKAVAGDGYHGLRPVRADECDALDRTTVLVFQELLANGLIPICAGVAPGPVEQGGAAVCPGLPVEQVQLAMSDWDNTPWAAERIKILSDVFPQAWLFYERLGDPNHASGIERSPHDPIDATWNISNGGLWIAQMQRLCPRFVGVLYEVNNWQGGATVEECAKELQQAHDGFWRDVQEVRFETNTYVKFWQGGERSLYDGLDAQLQARCPFLKGFLSGGASHPVVQAGPDDSQHAGDAADDMIPIADITFVGGADLHSFAKTAKLTTLAILADDITVEFDRQDTWPETPNLEAQGGMGPLQFCMGIALRVNGQWFASAPIELWKGKRKSGGPIQAQDIGDGTGRGQINANWFYNATWAPLHTHQPAPGEEIGFFLVAGDYRHNVFVIHERTQIVKFALPAPGRTLTLTWN